LCRLNQDPQSLGVDFINVQTVLIISFLLFLRINKSSGITLIGITDNQPNLVTVDTDSGDVCLTALLNSDYSTSPGTDAYNSKQGYLCRLNQDPQSLGVDFIDVQTGRELFVDLPCIPLGIDWNSDDVYPAVIVACVKELTENSSISIYQIAAYQNPKFISEVILPFNNPLIPRRTFPVVLSVDGKTMYSVAANDDGNYGFITIHIASGKVLSYVVSGLAGDVYTLMMYGKDQLLVPRNFGNSFYEVNPSTGNSKYLGSTDFFPNCSSYAVHLDSYPYDPVSNVVYTIETCIKGVDYFPTLYSVDLNNGSFTKKTVKTIAGQVSALHVM